MLLKNHDNLIKAVTTFKAKGRNQGGNQRKKVVTEDKLLINKELTKTVKWITVCEGRNRLGISDRVLRKHCMQGHFVTRKVKMNGGIGYEISVESMFSYYERLGDWEKCRRILGMLREEGNVQYSMLNVQCLSEDNGKKDIIINDVMMAKYQVTKLFDKALELAEKKSVTAERFAAFFNSGAYPELKGLIGEVSVRSLYRWRQLLNENGWDPSCLADNFKPISCRSISNKEAEIIIPLLLSPNKPLISEIIAEAKKQFAQKGIIPKSDIT